MKLLYSKDLFHRNTLRKNILGTPKTFQKKKYGWRWLSLIEGVFWCFKNDTGEKDSLVWTFREGVFWCFDKDMGEKDGSVWERLGFSVFKQICVSLFWPKARVLFTCITIATSFVPAAMLNLVTTFLQFKSFNNSERISSFSQLSS